MRVLIVEDEAVIARRLARLLRRVEPSIEAVGWVGSIAAARRELARAADEAPVDLLFLDLDLNGRDGFEVLEQEAPGARQTIIVSAHPERAITGFDHGVADFVAKPFTEERLRRALDRAAELNRETPAPARYLAVRVAGEVRPLPLEDLVYVQGAGDYAELHCRDGSTHLHGKTLAALEKELPEGFLRVHRSFIVRLSAVRALESEEGSRYALRLGDGRRVPVSRGRVGSVRERLI